MKRFLVLLVSLISIIVLAIPTRSNVGATHVMYGEGGGQESYTAADYVQDGLVCLWDGIENIGWGEHDSSATYWTELISGNQISINRTYGSQYGWDENSLIAIVYYPAVFHVDLTSFMLLPVRQGIFSYEVVTSQHIDSAGWNAQTVNIASSTDTAYNFGISIMKRKESNGYVDIDPNSTYFPGGYMIPEYVVGLQTTSAVYDGANGYFMVDGKSVKDTGKQIVPDETIESVILRFPARNYGFRGHYHCLRIYNRPLTEAEVKWNAMVDKARFSSL